jgi:hypothetical protein
MTIARVKNDSVWQSLKILFLGSSLIFLINIFFGFDNALTVGELPRWQILIHLHGGSIGWITLSAIGVNIWVLTNDREVSEGYATRIRWLVWGAVLVFAGYVPSFGLAFSRPSGFLVTLLPIFGSGSVLVLWISAIYALTQLSKQSVVTTVHHLAAGALLVAAIGATVGMLLGLERVIGQFLPLPADDRVGAHAGMMDTYLFLIASAIIEWFTLGELNKKWNIWGLLQTLFWAVGASSVPVAFFINQVDTVLPIFMLLLLLGIIIFIARMGWRALAKGVGSGRFHTWAFIGTVWLIVYMAVFLYFISLFVSGGIETLDPVIAGPFFVLFAHAAFVGMMTNLLLGVMSARGQSASNLYSWGEPAAMWLITLGILVFAGLKAIDIRYGAIVMGIGILVGLFTMIMRVRTAD